MASSPRSSPSLSGTPSTPCADDTTVGCETRSRISPRRGETDHSRSTASPAYSQPKTPEAGSPAPTWKSRRLSWVSSHVDDAAQSYGTRNTISPGIDESDISHGTSSASSTRPGTLKAGSPTLASPAQWHCGSGPTTPCNASRSRSPRKRRSKPRRTSQRCLRNIDAYVNSGPDASSDSDSDDDASARHRTKTYDDEEFHLSCLNECGHGGSGGGDDTEESGSPAPKRRKTCRFSASHSQSRRSDSASLDPDTSVAQARTTESACKIPSPPLSHDFSQDSHGRTTSAKFEEWLLPSATLKRVLLGNGRTTFQLQFDWDPQVDKRQARCPRRNKSGVPIARKSSRCRVDSARRISFTPEEDKLLLKLKADGLTWPAIHGLFSDTFPGRRSQVSLQVRYSTKLKNRGES